MVASRVVTSPLGIQKLQLPERLGGVRKEPRVLKPVPARRPPEPEKVPVQTTPRGTTVTSKTRPSNEFTIEEMRVQLAATAGPMRRFAGSIRNINLQSDKSIPGGTTRKLAEGNSVVPTYVRVVPSKSTQGSRRVHFTEGGPGGQQTAVSMILPDEGPFEAIVMPGEALYATLDDDAANAPFQLKVFEVGS